MPTNAHRDLPFVMVLIASARIGGLFGSTVGPLDPPLSEQSKVDEFRRRLGFRSGSDSPEILELVGRSGRRRTLCMHKQSCKSW